MLKKWFVRAAFAIGIPMSLIAGTAGAALATDTYCILSDIDGHQVAHMVHVDDGDVFKIYDDHADGAGPTGYLQVYTPTAADWVTVKSLHNGAGDGNPVSFEFDVLNVWAYRMKLCQDGVGCAYEVFSE